MKKYIKEYNRNLNLNYAASFWNATSKGTQTGRRLLFTQRKDDTWNIGTLITHSQRSKKDIQRLSI